MTVLLALSASALWGLADFGGGVLSRRRSAIAVLVVSQLIALAALAAAVLAVDSSLGPLTWQGVAAGAVGSGSLLLFYRCLATGPMGLVAPIASTGVVVPVVFGVITGDDLGMAQITGIALAVIGIVLASGPELQPGSAVRGSAVILAGVAALGFGTIYVLLVASPAPASSTLIAQRLTSGVIGLAILAASRTAPWLSRRDLGLVALVGIGDVAANGAFILASRDGIVSVVAVLASLYPVVTALLARYLLAERLRPIQAAGAATALGGVLLLGASA